MNKITFFGKDFSPIGLDIGKTKIDEFPFILNEEKLLKILILFLEKTQNDLGNFVVNSKGSSDSYKLYSLVNNEFYFDGIVGVFSKVIAINKSEIISSFDGEDEIIRVNVTLQIESRFDNNNDLIDHGPYFLATMLSNGNVDLSDCHINSNNNDSFFDFLLIFLFKTQLQKCFQSGYFKQYVRYNNNDDRFKGTLDVSRHIRLNGFAPTGEIAYSYRENTIDNNINKLIIFTFNYIKKTHPDLVDSIIESDFELTKKLNNLSYLINQNFDYRKVLNKCTKVISHPFFFEYEKIRKVCYKILKNEGISFFNENSENEIDGILFYIPDLWEQYIEKYLYGNSYILKPQFNIKILDYNDGVFKQNTYPDFVFFDKNSAPFMILDAKFKEKWGNILSNNKSFSSVLDDYNKCIRDMNSIAAHYSGVIFPTNNENIENTSCIEHNVSIYNKTDKFLTFYVIVPKIESEYSDWRTKFENNCLKTSQNIKNYINEILR